MQPASAVGLIVVAAGTGSRLGADVPKAFVPLAGVSLLGHALRGALACSDVAEVVRDLWRRDQDRGLSAGEKRMLAKARQILVSELALAEHTDEDAAAARLDEALAPAV